MTSDDYIARVIDRMPRAMPRRSQIAVELRGHITERIEHGQATDEVLRQLGDPTALADSYLSAVPLVPAPFGRRAAAKMVDLGAFLVCVAPVGWLALRQGGMFPVLLLPLAAFGFAAYFVVAEYSFGVTLGKRVLKMRVVRESGARISVGQSFVRQLPQFVQAFWLDILFALFTDRHQRAFEVLSHTRVVMADSEEGATH